MSSTTATELQESPRRSWWRAVLAAAVPAAVYLAVATHEITLPALYMDEHVWVPQTITFIHPGHPYQPAGGTGPTFGYHLHQMPVMTMDYVGTVKSILYVPVWLAFGGWPFGLRFLTIGLALLGLAATFLLVRRLIDVPTATVAITLLALDPTFVFYTRTDFGPLSSAFFLKTLALWQFATWWEGGRRRHLALGALAFGIGTWDKTNFLWIVAGSAIAIAVLAPRGLWQRLGVAGLLTGAGAYLLGALPLIVFNLNWPPRTWLAETGSATAGDSPSLWARLLERLHSLSDALTGLPPEQLFGLPHDHSLLVTTVVGLSVIVVLAWAILDRAWPARGAAAFFVVSCALTIVAAAATRGGFAVHHIILTYPLPHVIAAIFLVRAGRWLTDRVRLRASWALAATALLVAPLLAVDTVTIGRDFADLDATGGRGNWSDAIYRLDGGLSARGAYGTTPVISVDWGTDLPLVALSRGRCTCYDVWPIFATQPPDSAQIHNLLAEPGAVFVLHSTDTTTFPVVRATFFAAAAHFGVALQRSAIYYTRDGKPDLELWSVLGTPRLGLSGVVQLSPGQEAP